MSCLPIFLLLQTSALKQNGEFALSIIHLCLYLPNVPNKPNDYFPFIQAITQSACVGQGWLAFDWEIPGAKFEIEENTKKPDAESADNNDNAIIVNGGEPEEIQLEELEETQPLRIAQDSAIETTPFVKFKEIGLENLGLKVAKCVEGDDIFWSFILVADKLDQVHMTGFVLSCQSLGGFNLCIKQYQS